MKNPSANAGDRGSTPRLGRSPGEGTGNRLQCSCQENSIDRGAWWAAVHGVLKSRTQLSDQHFHCLSSFQRCNTASQTTVTAYLYQPLPPTATRLYLPLETLLPGAQAHQFSSVQFSRSVVSDSLRPHESQHARPPCPSPTPGVHSDSRPLSR